MDAYPPARRLELVEDLHGHAVADPYRWLEDAAAGEVVAWSKAQDALARAHLDSLPGREPLRRRLHELLDAGAVGVPRLRGGRSFFIRRAPGQEHGVLLVREPDGTERALVDPAALSPDGTVTLDGWTPSVEGDRLAYLLSEGGDEEARLYVMDVATADTVDGPIDRTRYASIAWLPGGEELFYVRRLAPDAVPEGEGQFHRRVWRHRIGRAPDEDELVFGEGRDKAEYYGLHVSRDGRWLSVTASVGTAPRTDVHLADLAGDGLLVPVQEGVDARTGASVYDGTLWVLTDRDAPRGRIAVADPAEPTRWSDVVPESETVIEGFELTDDAVVVAGTVHAVGRVAVHDRVTGVLRSELELPGVGSVDGLATRPEGGSEVWFGYTDFVTPSQVHRADVATGDVELWAAPPGRVTSPEVATRQVTCTSADGTEVRLFVLDAAGPGGGPRAGPRPTILYGYGGFGVSLGPAYSAGILAWVEQGGVYAVANLRGGGEEGEAWHRAGMREHKQHVFEDFAAAARRLVTEGVTDPTHLGISGGSNGGLLVGAALTRDPDLYAAVVCSAPLLDMVRYERFGLGTTWNDEYGRADDPEELAWLLGYSPYHHVVEGTAYPAVLFTVFDADTRVDPLHARKLAAALQWATGSPPERPVLYRREADVGHAARSVTRMVDLGVDTTAFLAAQLGLALR